MFSGRFRLDTGKKQHPDSEAASEGGSAHHHADELDQQAALLDQQIQNREKELLNLEKEYEMLQADMLQVIRYSHMEKLTQKLVDTFIKKIYVYKDKKVEIEWNFRQK